MASSDFFLVTHIGYYNGLDRVSFEARLPCGKGFRTITVAVPPEEIVRLADLLRPVLQAEDPSRRGHAVYHFQHPTVLHPCSMCREFENRSPGGE